MKRVTSLVQSKKQHEPIDVIESDKFMLFRAVPAKAPILILVTDVGNSMRANPGEFSKHDFGMNASLESCAISTDTRPLF